MTPPSLADVTLSTEPSLRGRRELSAQLAALRHWRGGEPTAEFYRGATAALAWLLAGGPNPLTGGYTRPVTALAVITELVHAEDLIRTGRISTDRPRQRHYLIGLEHALQWAGHDTAVAPLPVSSTAEPDHGEQRTELRWPEGRAADRFRCGSCWGDAERDLTAVMARRGSGRSPVLVNPCNVA